MMKRVYMTTISTMWRPFTMRKKKEFPNNWKAYHKAPSEYFQSIPFDHFMDWKVFGWDLPSSIDCIIREEDPKTGKIKEHVYMKSHAARNKVNKLMDEKAKFVLVTSEAVHNLSPETYYDDDNKDVL